MMSTALAIFLALAQNDKTRANSYDDAWEADWAAHCTALYNAGSGKTAGFVIHVGDSITYSNPYGQWARYGSGKTIEDGAVLTWCMATQAFPGGVDATNKNGFYLAAVDASGSYRSLTAASGIGADEILSGNGNGGPLMPAEVATGAARTTLVNSSYTGNISLQTLSWAFADARIAVVMLGTNDFGASRTAAAFGADLGAIVDALEARNIVVVLSTIPPRTSGDVSTYNATIRSLAQSKKLPLIDYYAEILARRSGITWQGTLIGGDGIHPTTGASSADPYSPGGDASTHTTGDNCLNDGYLLRDWLTVQKLKEVKSYVVDGVIPPGGAPPPAPAPSPAPGGSSSGGGGGHHCGGSIRACGSPWVALLAGAALALALFRRR